MQGLSGEAAKVADALAQARPAARTWAGWSLAARLAVIGRARRLIAREAAALAATIARPRAPGESLVAEVLPLAEAARFLERRAPALLAPRRPRGGRPLWLLGVRAQVVRDPLGVVLVLGPSNYPLFLPGAQILQALAAGNAVCAKPAPGCTAPLAALAALLAQAGLPPGVLQLLAEDVATGEAAAASGFDRIVLTGSAETGMRVLATAAAHLTPCAMELSGSDAVFVMPGADLALVADCLAYGLRLNGSATCIAPRRVFVPAAESAALEAALLARVSAIPPAAVPDRVCALLETLLDEAEQAGARVLARPGPAGVPPILVADAGPDMRLLREDVFAPVLSLVPVDGPAQARAAAALCPYALGASVFGPSAAAQAFARQVDAGSVVVNDLIVPTADPRLPFGGRHRSGFGVTRGSEGLLEMTALKTISVRQGRLRPHLDPAQPEDEAWFAGLVGLLHGDLRTRLAGLRALIRGREGPRSPPT